MKNMIFCISVLLSLSACADLQIAKNAYARGDYEEAEKNYVVLAEDYNLAEAKMGLARVYKKKNQPQIYENKIIGLLKDAVHANYPGAGIELAETYQDITHDGFYDLQIINLLQKAGDEKGGRAFFDLGQIYDSGSLPLIDRQGFQAEGYYIKASEAGYWRADFFRAKLYERGEIIPRDREKAIALYRHVWQEHHYDRALAALQKMGAA